MKLIWQSNSQNPCPSCSALDGQVHTQSAWDEFGVKPQHHALYCQHHCSCTLTETNLEEQGNLADVPLRQSSNQERNMKNKNVMPILYSIPIHQRVELPARAELIPQIESGKLEYIDFEAKVFGTGKNRNPYRFKDQDLEIFAKSFEGQLFLRNHDTADINSRDGTILESTLEGNSFKQKIRLTTRRGMLDFIEGKIDRFSIGWYYDDVTCSICNSSYFDGCSHWAGKKYKTDSGDKTCMLIFINPQGKETSAVNTPAVEGTHITARLDEYKLEIYSGNADKSRARRASNKTLLLKGVNPMAKRTKTAAPNLNDDEVDETEITEQQRAALELQGADDMLNTLQEQSVTGNEILIAQCQTLLDTSLSASKLPEASQKVIRKAFEAKLQAGKAFKPTELQEAIKDKREELAELNDSQKIAGVAQHSITSMFNGEDQFKAALADLFQVERPQGLEKMRVRQLRGIQEAYILGTGDIDFHGGYNREFSLVTTNFTGIVADLLNKRLIQAWKDYEEVYGWWKKIVTIEHFNNLNDVKWIRTGTISSLPSVSERGEYQELPIGDNKESSTWGKSGGYIPLTLEAVLRDDTRAFLRMPNEAGLAGIRNVSEKVAEIFTQNSGAGPVLSDTGNLFNATVETAQGGHANLRTTALDATEWKAVRSAMYNRKLLVKNEAGKYGTGKKLAMYPKFLLVPVELRDTANDIILNQWLTSDNKAAHNLLYGTAEPVTVPEWTDTNNFAAVQDPKLMPGVMLGEIFGVIPQIFSASSETDPAMFANDESRLKVRQFLTVGVADDRPLHKSNVA